MDKYFLKPLNCMLQSKKFFAFNNNLKEKYPYKSEKFNSVCCSTKFKEAKVL